MTRLQAGSRQHPLAKALIEYGKLLRTLHALRWFCEEPFRRRIGRQLNRGESLNSQRRFIAFADSGKEKYRHHEDQSMQAHCLDQAWVADIPDLQHCSAFGDTAQEALAEVLEGKQAWLESAEQHGDPIPEPRYRPAIYAV